MSRAARLGAALRTLAAAPEGLRLPLVRVWEAFHAAFPHLRGQPQARAELRGLLGELAAAGTLRLPRAPRAYDRVQQPPLPGWVQLPALPESEGPLARAARLPWHPALHFVRGLPRLTEGELASLRHIQRFLAATDPDQPGPLITARERSLRLFGDEKRLDRLRGGQLFQPGRLSAELLRCRFVHAPFVYRDFAHGSDALIIENHDTYHSACAARAASPDTALRWIIFGCGNAILQSAAGMADSAPQPTRLWYFGDLDWRGLEIAWELQGLLRRLHLPPLRLIDACYQRLHEFPASKAHSQARRVHGAVHRDALLALLPLTLRATVAATLEGGERWAQEWITQEEWTPLLPALSG